MEKVNRRSSVRIRLHNEDSVGITFITDRGNLISGSVWDYSRYGLGIRLTEQDVDKFKVKGEIKDCILQAYGQEKRLGKGTISRKQKDGNFVFLGIYLHAEFVDMDSLFERHSIHLHEDESKTILLQFNNSVNIKPEFKEFASDFAVGLSIYKRQLDEIDSKFQNEPISLKNALFNSLLQGIGKDCYNYISNSLEKLKVLVKSYTKQEHERHGFYMRKLFWNFIMESEFIKRTNLKPRGYAGDSEMMEMLYRHEYIGKSSFGKIFHYHPASTKAADAVRNRRRLINEDLNNTIARSAIKTNFKILSIACGPAWEIQDFFKESGFRYNVDVTLLDQDTEALGEARRGIESVPVKSPLRVKYVQESVRTLLKSSNPEIQFGKFDFIYSMGLYDYLTDPVAKVLTEKLFSMLSPNGELIIGNYHKNNETRIYMEYIMDWVLYYRDEESMGYLVEDIKEEFLCEVGLEPSETQMFMRITRK